MNYTKIETQGKLKKSNIKLHINNKLHKKHFLMSTNKIIPNTYSLKLKLYLMIS